MRLGVFCHGPAWGWLIISSSLWALTQHIGVMTGFGCTTWIVIIKFRGCLWSHELPPHQAAWGFLRIVALSPDIWVSMLCPGRRGLGCEASYDQRSEGPRGHFKGTSPLEPPVPTYGLLREQPEGSSERKDLEGRGIKSSPTSIFQLPPIVSPNLNSCRILQGPATPYPCSSRVSPGAIFPWWWRSGQWDRLSALPCGGALHVLPSLCLDTSPAFSQLKLPLCYQRKLFLFLNLLTAMIFPFTALAATYNSTSECMFVGLTPVCPTEL